MSEDAFNDMKALDIFMIKERIKKRKLETDIIWERSKTFQVRIEWDRKMNCLNCLHEFRCPMSYDNRDGKDECPYHFWKDFIPFMKQYNVRNEYLGQTSIPIPVKYFAKWSFMHEIDIYTDKVHNFLEIFKVFWWCIFSLHHFARRKWDDYLLVRTRKTVLVGFIVGMLVGFILSNLLLWMLFGGSPWKP